LVKLRDKQFRSCADLGIVGCYLVEAFAEIEILTADGVRLRFEAAVWKPLAR
jgi:hypothetical protein